MHARTGLACAEVHGGWGQPPSSPEEGQMPERRREIRGMSFWLAGSGCEDDEEGEGIGGVGAGR